MKMKNTLFVIFIIFAVFSFGQTPKEYILKDISNRIKANPYQNQLDTLYIQPDSIEIFFVPEITPPELYVFRMKSMDTIFIKYNAESIGYFDKTIVEYIAKSGDIDHLNPVERDHLLSGVY